MKKSAEETKKVNKLSKKALIAISLCAAAIVLIGVIFANVLLTYDKVLPNIYIEDLKVGGISVEAAEENIRGTFRDVPKGRSVNIICCGNEKSVSFDELNFEVDVEKTTESVYQVGRSKGDFRKALKIISLAFKPEKIDLEVSFDEAKFDEIIAELSNGKEELPVETAYTLDGKKLTITKGHGGKMINREAATKKLIMAATDPNIKEINLELETIEAKTPDLEEFYQELTAPVKNAEYVLENGEIRIEPEKVGIKVDKAEVKKALDSGQEWYTLEVETKEPEVTAEELEALLFRDTLGSFSSSFATSTYARASNVILTAERINGKILMPGDVFSYDATIGKRTAANGYKEAGVYIGNKVESGIGGGICQTSSTLYSAVLYSNLEIVSRTSHSLPVSYVPLGQDATIAEGYIDFKFKNNSEYPIKITATVNGRQLNCSILGVKNPNISVELVNTIVSTSDPKTERTENAEVPKGYKRILNKGAKGYTVASQRIVKNSGEVIKTEKLTKSVYRAAPVEEEVNPADKDTPTEELKIYVDGMEIPEENPKTPEAEDESKPETAPEEAENPPVIESDMEEPNPTEDVVEENVEEIVNV